MKFLADGIEFHLDLLSEAFTAGGLLAVEGLLEDLTVGPDLRLRNVIDLFNLVYGLHIHAIQLNGVMRIGLATNGPSKEGTITTGCIEGRSIIGEGQGCNATREYGMALDLIALSDVVQNSQNEVAVTTTSDEELGLHRGVPASRTDVMRLDLLNRGHRSFLHIQL
jgi:hypothetical protein